MSDIPVTAQYDLSAASCKVLEHGKKSLKKSHFYSLSVFSAGARGKIDGNHAERIKVGAYVTSLCINFRDSQAFCDGVWLDSGINPDTAVSFLFSAVEIALV
jgi:hypothetical protein